MTNNIDLQTVIDTGLVDRGDIDILRESSPGTNDGEIVRVLLQQSLITNYQLIQIKKGVESFRLGEYVIRDWIGLSGNNDVLLAKRRIDHEQYYVVIHRFGTETRESRENFVSRLKLIANLRHELWATTIEVQTQNVPPYVSFGTQVNGQTVESVVKQSGAFSVKDSLQLACGLLRGLSAAHQAGIVHGDINPRIIMIHGSCEHISILPVLGSDWTIGSSMLVDFTSPERMRGVVSADSMSDVYGTGCLLYYCITGITPFYFVELSSRRVAHLAQKPYNPCQFNREIPRKMLSTIAAMIEKSSSNRPSINEALATLEAL